MARRVSEAVSTAQQWLKKLDVVRPGVILRIPPIYSDEVQLAIYKEVRKTGYEIIHLDFILVVPTKEADPELWHLIQAPDIDSKLALIDKLKDQYPHLQAEAPARIECWTEEVRAERRQEKIEQIAETAPKLLQKAVPETSTRLNDLKGAIAREHEEVIESVRTTVGIARSIGERLAEVKRLVGHGHFCAWLESNVPFSQRTAQNYMRIYRNWESIVEKTQSVADLTLNNALGAVQPHHLVSYDSLDSIDIDNVEACLAEAERRGDDQVAAEAADLRTKLAQACEDEEVAIRRQAAVRQARESECATACNEVMGVYCDTVSRQRSEPEPASEVESTEEQVLESLRIEFVAIKQQLAPAWQPEFENLAFRVIDEMRAAQLDASE